MKVTKTCIDGNDKKLAASGDVQFFLRKLKSNEHKVKTLTINFDKYEYEGHNYPATKIKLADISVANQYILLTYFKYKTKYYYYCFDDNCLLKSADYYKSKYVIDMVDDFYDKSRDIDKSNICFDIGKREPHFVNIKEIKKTECIQSISMDETRVLISMKLNDDEDGIFLVIEDTKNLHDTHAYSITDNIGLIGYKHQRVNVNLKYKIIMGYF